MTIFMRIMFVVIIIIMLLSLVLVPTIGAAACGATAARVLARGEGGPYQVSFGVLPEQPSLGYVRLVATVCDKVTGQPVSDAQVTFVPTNPQGVKGAPILALNKFGGSEEYSAELAMKQSGTWRYQVMVKGALGDVALESPVEVKAPPVPEGLASQVFLLVNVVLLSGGLYIAWTIRRRTAMVAHRQELHS